MHNFLYQTVRLISIYILFAEIIKTFWFKDGTDIQVLVYFESKDFYS